jgi:hypothetical protein
VALIAVLVLQVRGGGVVWGRGGGGGREEAGREGRGEQGGEGGALVECCHETGLK